jgi:hypothetical protein
MIDGKSFKSASETDAIEDEHFPAENWKMSGVKVRFCRFSPSSLTGTEASKLFLRLDNEILMSKQPSTAD